MSWSTTRSGPKRLPSPSASPPWLSSFSSSSLSSSLMNPYQPLLRPRAPSVRPPAGSRRPPSVSNIQVLRFQGMLLDEPPPGIHIGPHEDGEVLVGLVRILQPHFQESPLLRVHGGLEELIGVHLPQSLEPLHAEAFRLLHLALHRLGDARQVVDRLALLLNVPSGGPGG